MKQKISESAAFHPRHRLGLVHLGDKLVAEFYWHSRTRVLQLVRANDCATIESRFTTETNAEEHMEAMFRRLKSAFTQARKMGIRGNVTLESYNIPSSWGEKIESPRQL